MGTATTSVQANASDLRTGDRIVHRILGVPTVVTVRSALDVGAGFLVSWTDDSGLTGSAQISDYSLVTVVL